MSMLCILVHTLKEENAKNDRVRYNKNMTNILKDPAIAPMLEQALKRTYSKGQTVLYPDHHSADVYVIASGAISMHDIDDEGNRKILHIFGPPALFPMVSFSDDLVGSAWFYTALVDTEVYILPYEEFRRRLEEVDGFTVYNLLLKQLLQEVHELLIRIASSTKANSQARLVAALKFLEAHHAKVRSTNWCPINFPVSHQLLADMTGLTRETVSVAIKQLQQQKAVRSLGGGKLEINRVQLRKL